MVKIQDKYINPTHILWMSTIKGDGVGGLAFEVHFTNGATYRFEYASGAQATTDQNTIIKALGGRP